MENAPVAAVAERLDITPGNAAVRLHRARQALKKRLEAACGTRTAHGCLAGTCDEAPR
ncbi:MAG: sigma-70 family RNA polymerase sigma factor [Candidatus Rokubacteria bacterium]|nr:sigma-70 family RNA polymerase sigma factor [Candidatus Rokubacteria bacterium]